jgi:nucleotidyltransferase substrate binding protein (TIGR01987 family)
MGVSLAELEKALSLLDQALSELKVHATKPESSQYQLIRDASIQRFEYCVELSWKVSAKTMGTKTTAPKQVVREMAQNQLIEDPTLWFDFLEGRNKSSHAYDENLAKEVTLIAVQFLPAAQDLLSKLKSK